MAKRRIPMPPPSKVRPGRRKDDEPLEWEEEMAEGLRRPKYPSFPTGPLPWGIGSSPLPTKKRT